MKKKTRILLKIYIYIYIYIFEKTFFNISKTIKYIIVNNYNNKIIILGKTYKK